MAKTAHIFESVTELREKYEHYYHFEELKTMTLFWKNERTDDPGAVHAAVENALDEIIKRIQR